MRSEMQWKLIEVATPLFATKGFAGVSVRDVTDAAAMNVSAVSYHFNGKGGLYQAVLEEQFVPIRQALKSAQGEDLTSPIERLSFYAEQIFHIHAARPFLVRFMIAEVNNPTDHGGEVIEKHISQVYRFVLDTLQEGIDEGSLRSKVDITYAAIAFVGILNFYFISKPLVSKLTPLPSGINSEYAKQALQIYLYGIAHNRTEDVPAAVNR